MIDYFIQGLSLGIAYVAPIGMQNIYVINTAASKPRLRAYQVALITIFFDISLALACFWGVGALLVQWQFMKLAVMLLGSLAVIYIGVQLIRSNPNLNSEMDVNKSLLQVAATCFMVTWLNPQAIIDGSLLLGSFRTALPRAASGAFIMGVCIASLSWFIGLTTLVSIFKKSFNEKLIRWINIICGTVIVYYGIRLGYINSSQLIRLVNNVGIYLHALYYFSR